MTPIPQIMHQIWIGDADPPAELMGFRQGLLDLHPTWQHFFHRDESAFGDPCLGSDLRKALCEAATRVRTYKTTHHPLALVADLLRMTVLHNHGGVYADLDMQAVKPLDGFLNTDLLLCSSGVCNPDLFLMGAPPRSPAILTILTRIMAARPVPGPGARMLMLNCLPSLRREFGWEAFAAEYFCPLDREGRGTITENTHAIHRWRRHGAGEGDGKGTSVG